MANTDWRALLAAHLLNRHHERYCNGFYGGEASQAGRWFGARADRHAFELTPDFGRSWVSVDLAAATFRTGGGQQIHVAPAHEVQVRLTASICNEYRTRAVFGPDDPEWPEVPDKVGRITIPWATAVVMLEDAEFQGDRQLGPEQMPVGVRRAYQALGKQLRKAMELPDREAPKLPEWCRVRH